MAAKPNPLNIGQFQIPEPCTVPWEQMDAHTAGNRFCRSCNHVVHDLTGMSEHEIEVLMAAQGGKLCGAFALDVQGNAIYFKQDPPRKKARFLKHFAAAASLILLYQTPQAGRAMAPTTLQPPADPIAGSPNLTPRTNTLLSGVILTQDSIEIGDSLLVEIFAKGNLLVSTYAKAGLFHHDFADALLPTDVIKIVVHGKTFAQGELYNERKYKGNALITTLGNAQNVQVRVQYTPPVRRIMTGGRLMKVTDI
jgi:hypothetical protein